MKKVVRYEDIEGGLHESQTECEETDDMIQVQKIMNEHAGMDASFYLDDFLRYLKKNPAYKEMVIRVIERRTRE